MPKVAKKAPKAVVKPKKNNAIKKTAKKAAKWGKGSKKVIQMYANQTDYF